MERVKEARQKAQRHIQVADHLAYVTYNFVKDPKLLLSIMNNLFLALDNGMGALLHLERYKKRVPPVHDNFESKYDMFRDHCAEKYNFDPPYLKLLREIRDTINEHKKSPVEFSKDSNFVICSQTYKMRTLSLDKIKKFITQSKLFIGKIENIIVKNERIHV